MYLQSNVNLQPAFLKFVRDSRILVQVLFNCIGEGEGEVAFFSAKRWDRRNRADLIESATPCHDAQVVGLYRDSNPLRLTILAAMSEDYTTAPQHLRHRQIDILLMILHRQIDIFLTKILQ